MSTTATKPYDNQEAIANKLLPQDALTPDPDEAYDNILNYSQFARLTSQQKVLLKAMVVDYASNNIRPETQLANDLGINRRTIYQSKASPAFSQALGMMMVAITGGEADIHLQNLRKMELDADIPPSIRYQISKFLLEYGGSYTRKSQVETRNLSISMRQAPETGDFSDSIDRFLIAMGTKGWSKERLNARWDELKTQQAW